MTQSRTYEATTCEVHSGDDFVFMVDLGVGGLFIRKRCRLHGVDAPNAYKAGPDTEAGEVREEVRRLLSRGLCFIEVISEGRGWWIVKLTVVPHSGDPICVNTLLRQRGYIYSHSQEQDHGTTE